MEWNDVYDARRRLTGQLHQRGTPWNRGEYGLVVCVWVHDGAGHLLLTQRAPEKSFAGTWENSGGAAQAGESSRQAIARELREETGICAEEDEFELLYSERGENTFYDFYCLKRDTPIAEIVLQPGETIAAKWVTFWQMHQMIQSGEICRIIGIQFRAQEQMLLSRQSLAGRAK